jgi:hypothetical protein
VFRSLPVSWTLLYGFSTGGENENGLYFHIVFSLVRTRDLCSEMEQSTIQIISKSQITDDHNWRSNAIEWRRDRDPKQTPVASPLSGSRLSVPSAPKISSGRDVPRVQREDLPCCIPNHRFPSLLGFASRRWSLLIHPSIPVQGSEVS